MLSRLKGRLDGPPPGQSPDGGHPQPGQISPQVSLPQLSPHHQHEGKRTILGKLKTKLRLHTDSRTYPHEPNAPDQAPPSLPTADQHGTPILFEQPELEYWGTENPYPRRRTTALNANADDDELDQQEARSRHEHRRAQKRLEQGPKDHREGDSRLSSQSLREQDAMAAREQRERKRRQDERPREHDRYFSYGQDDRLRRRETDDQRHRGPRPAAPRRRDKSRSQSASPSKPYDRAPAYSRATRPSTSGSDCDRPETPPRTDTKPRFGDMDRGEQGPTATDKHREGASITISGQRNQSAPRTGDDYPTDPHRVSYRYPGGSNSFDVPTAVRDEDARRKAGKDARQLPKTGSRDDYDSPLRPRFDPSRGLPEAETPTIPRYTPPTWSDPAQPGVGQDPFASSEDTEARPPTQEIPIAQAIQPVKRKPQASVDGPDSAEALQRSQREKRPHGSPTKRMQQRSEREEDLEFTLETILKAVKSRSASIEADMVSVRVGKCSVEHADRAVGFLLQFYDDRHDEETRERENRIADAVSQEKKSWKREHQTAMDHLLAQIDQLTGDHQALQHNYDGLYRAKEQSDSELRSLHAQLGEKGRMIETLRTELGQWESKHQNAMVRAVADANETAAEIHARETASLKLQFEERITTLQTERNGLIKSQAEAQRRHQQELDRRDAQRRDEVQKLTSEASKARTQHSEEVQTLKAETAQVRTDAANQETELMASFEHEKREIEERHADDVYDLKRAVADKDGSKPLADSDMARLFGKLALLVDQLASKIQWNPKKEKTWPYRDRALPHSHTRRQLQKLIVQQEVWVVLDKRIFCTPFRVLAETGTAVEKAWMSTFGELRRFSERTLTPQGDIDVPSEWPKPTQRSEQVRYAIVREWLDSLESSTTKQTWMEDYSSTLDSAAEDMLDVVAKVSYLDNDSKTAKQVRDIVQLAATFWLKMGSQRCRIRLGMMLPNLGGSVDGREHLPARLVAKPELRRAGNFLGQELDVIDEVVAECYGDIYDVSST